MFFVLLVKYNNDVLVLEDLLVFICNILGKKVVVMVFLGFVIDDEVKWWE